MTPNPKRAGFLLSTGREVYAWANVVGIDPNLEVFSGYDDDVVRPNDNDWTAAEKAELADHMIELWTRFKGGSRWQPIETAPKDGTPIIVGFDFASVWIVHKAFYRSADDLKDLIEHKVGDWSLNDVGWWSYTTGSVTQEQLDGHRTPTHWLPMPDLPKEIKR